METDSVEADALRTAADLSPGDFEGVLELLDRELRLITPAEDMAEVNDAGAGPRHYQLTHDYLVPSLREWLTRRQRESRRGRAELSLEERTAIWNGRPENKQLPGLLEFLSIRFRTAEKFWSTSQRQMMRAATRLHTIRALFAASVVLAATIVGVLIRQQVVDQQSDTRARGAVEGLLSAQPGEVARFIAAIDDVRPWAIPKLRREFARAEDASVAKLNAGLGLLHVDARKADFLGERLLNATPQQFLVLRGALFPHRQQLIESYWSLATSDNDDEKRRFRAAMALALFANADPRWQQIRGFVVDRLVHSQISHVVTWQEALRPVAASLIPPLGVVYRNPEEPDRAGDVATETLIRYAANDPRVMFDLLADAGVTRFPLFLELLMRFSKEAARQATAELSRTPAADATESAKSRLASRQANAAVMLMRMGKFSDVWTLLRHSAEPDARSYLIHRAPRLGVDVAGLLARFNEEKDVSVRRALLLCLGEFDDTQLTRQSRQALLSRLQEIYRNHPDAGLHGCVAWLLRKWGEAERVWSLDRELRIDESQRKARKLGHSNWYVNSQGQTYVVLRAGETLVGTTPSAPNAGGTEHYHRRRINRTFALAAYEVRAPEFQRFDFEFDARKASPDALRNNIAFYHAAAYCNWLSEQEGIPPGNGALNLTRKANTPKA